MNQQQQNNCLKRTKVGPEPSSTSLLFSVQAAKAVMILCEGAGTPDHTMLEYAKSTNHITV